MPPLPNFLFKKYTKELGLSDYDAGNLTDNKDIALYYEEIIKHTKNYKAAVNWLMGDIKSYLNKYAVTINNFPISAKQISLLIKLIEEGKVSNNLASQKVFPKMLEETIKMPQQIAEENNWIQESDSDSLAEYVEQIMTENPDETERFKNGEKKLMGFFMGQLMKKSKGKADPKTASQLINQFIK
jgi:aspartyl-tRNA(Asn)/glutamyl-tRNA(Gln) amidotransferase subunit B